MKYYYYSGSELHIVNHRGEVTRPEIGMNQPSGDWVITGAVRLNNFGYEVERVGFPECLMNARAWTHKNGKPQWHLTDLDHGTHRIQVCPGVTNAGMYKSEAA